MSTRAPVASAAAAAAAAALPYVSAASPLLAHVRLAPQPPPTPRSIDDPSVTVATVGIRFTADASQRKAAATDIISVRVGVFHTSAEVDPVALTRAAQMAHRLVVSQDPGEGEALAFAAQRIADILREMLDRGPDRTITVELLRHPLGAEPGVTYTASVTLAPAEPYAIGPRPEPARGVAERVTA